MKSLSKKRQECPGATKMSAWPLYGAIAMPMIYFGTQLVAAPFFPGYSFSRDTASMLGTTDSHCPWIFNLGAMLTGVAGLIGAVGLFRAFRAVTWTTLGVLVGLCVAANGVLSVKAGLFPMPDPRHASWQFLMPAILLTPLLLLIGLWSQGVALRVYLSLNLLALLALIPLMMHRLAPVFGEGTQQRIFAALVFVPIGVAGYFLARRNSSIAVF